MNKQIFRNRRQFLRDSALLAGAISIGAQAQAAPRRASMNEKLNIGIIGAGGKGMENLRGVQSENVAALCDVDEERCKEARAMYPNVPFYRDFRVMLEKEKSLDAVTVSTPDHTHAIAAITAMRLGKHVYCEKPLGHSIYEVREMARVAREQGVVTQMGQQGHSFEGTRRAVETVRAGTLGEVRELHVWTDRPAGWWPQGENRPTETPPVPATLDWDLWLGPAAERPYNPIYVPFKWRGRWDFGTGSFGDMAVHCMDTAYWALELGVPISAEVIDSDKKTDDCPALWNIIEMVYPARASQPPVRMRFYDGKKLPPAELFFGEKIAENGALIVGSKGSLYCRTWNGGQTADDMHWLLPRKQFIGFVPPPATLPRTPEHHMEWILACKGGPKTESNFEYASKLTEGLLVGYLAQRLGKRIEWDSANMKAKGLPEADALIHPKFRKGWEI